MNQAGMNQDTVEGLSAGMDGELSREQLRFLLRRLDHDPSMQQAWTNYHVARDGLRRQLPPLASTGFAARVMLAIETESVSTVQSSAPRRRGHWLRWSAGGAIAASVAAAALMIGQPAGEGERMAATAPQTAVVAMATSTSQPTAAPAAVPPWLSGNAAGMLSQQASATLGAPFGQNQSMYARRLSGYSAMPRYRTLDNNDGSYLLLLNPARPGRADAQRRASAIAQ